MNKRIYIPEEEVEDILADEGEGPMSLLHELAHVVFSIPPGKIDEPGSGMLAMEYEAVRRLKIPGWSCWMRNYVVYVDRLACSEEWRYITRNDRAGVLKDAREGAEAQGVLNKNGKPTYRIRLNRKDRRRVHENQRP